MRRDARRWITLAAGACAVFVALAGAIWWFTRNPDRVPAPRGQIGVFKGSIETADVEEFERWLGRPVDLMESFPAEENWEQLEGPDWLLRPLTDWAAARSGRRIVLSLPMLPGGDTDDDDTVKRELRAGAAGNFNEHFRVLADRLVARGLADTIVRVGWEFNGDWYRWRAAPDPDAWAEYFRQIVTTMRGVPGAGFEFDWNVAVQGEPFDATRAYPGDEYVDYIGVDVYDKSWIANGYPLPSDAGVAEQAARRRHVWEQALLHGPDGLERWAAFARERDKRLSVPEWGVASVDEDGVERGGLDNAEFVRRVAEWMDSRNVAYHVYFDYDGPDGNHELSAAHTEFPAAADAFKGLFGAGARR